MRAAELKVDPLEVVHGGLGHLNACPQTATTSDSVDY
jgi:hypothetical protein